MKINWVKKIGNKAIHNAFVDLCLFNEHLFCCYREATNHISGDGKICVLTLDKSGTVVNTVQIRLPDTDLRDPKLSITPNGHLLLIAFARKNGAENKTLSTRNLCWFSHTGKSWSSHIEFAEKGWWLWRLTWYEDIAYGFAYNRKRNAINLFSGDPRRSFHRHVTSAFSLTKHGKGYPNESALIFDDKKAYGIVRRDADTYTAQFGESDFPYKKWKWTDLKQYIGGPAMLQLDSNNAILAGRVVKESRLVTGIFTLNLKTAILTEQLILPSKGDNSYPGLVLMDSTLYVSYYSSHLDNKSSVYLSKIELAEKAF
ncbi:hypothetical protein [Paraglaciecola sp.]|uniref:hypothetical protein n=1 Tax=Paraglaciecola sp. TaxID=1920173 RepID=UPI003266E350